MLGFYIYLSCWMMLCYLWLCLVYSCYGVILCLFNLYHYILSLDYTYSIRHPMFYNIVQMSSLMPLSVIFVVI
jgi:hypothetical protein